MRLHVEKGAASGSVRAAASGPVPVDIWPQELVERGIYWRRGEEVDRPEGGDDAEPCVSLLAGRPRVDLRDRQFDGFANLFSVG